MDYGLLKSGAQISKYFLMGLTAVSGWISFHYKTTEDSEVNLRKVLTPAGRTFRVLFVFSTVLAITSAIVEDVADSKLRAEAEDQGNKKVAALLETQHKNYVADLRQQIEGSVLPEIKTDTEKLQGVARKTLQWAADHRLISVQILSTFDC